MSSPAPPTPENISFGETPIDLFCGPDWSPIQVCFWSRVRWINVVSRAALLAKQPQHVIPSAVGGRYLVQVCSVAYEVHHHTTCK